MSEDEAQRATSSLATETKLDQLFDWRQLSTFNRIRNFIAYFMGIKNRRDLSMQTRSTKRTIFVSICSKRMPPEFFEIDTK